MIGLEYKSMRMRTCRLRFGLDSPQAIQLHSRNQPMTAFKFLFRVRYPECDAQGVVFNARYGDYTDLSVTEYLRACIGSYSALVNLGYETQVVKLLIEWKSSARFDDVICAEVQAAHFGNTSFTLAVAMSNAATGALIANAQCTYVMVNADTFEKTPIPENLKHSLSHNAAGKVHDMSGGFA